MTHRRFVFTLNNPHLVSPEYHPRAWPEEKIKLCVYQMEVGALGTQHLQGYIEMKQACREAAMRKLSPSAHWEIAKGTRYQCIEYSTKEDTRLENPWYFDGILWIACGDVLPLSLQELKNPIHSLSKNSKSTAMSSRLFAIRDQLSEPNCNSTEAIADSDFDLWVRYYRAFEKYLVMKTKPRNHPVDVHIVQGPTGTGKSKWALDTYPEAYWKQRSNWWDGYAGHEVVVIDEFYGWLPFDLLLRICDRYPLLVETKGGQMQFVAKTIVITTNALPSSWYKCATYFPALTRRVTKWHVLPIIGCHSIHNTYQEFCLHAVENVVCP